VCCDIGVIRSHKYSVSLSEGALHYLMKYLRVSLQTVLASNIIFLLLCMLVFMFVCLLSVCLLITQEQVHLSLPNF